ncbi:hypothetical protein Tco_1228088 [Tanacetum coccineum]
MSRSQGARSWAIECAEVSGAASEQGWSRSLDTGGRSKNGVYVIEKVVSLESELKKTKQTYNAAFTKLINRVKKLEQIIKTSQSRRRAKVVISDNEKAEEDPSNQGRSLIEELDLDAGISLVPPHATDQGRIDEHRISGST